MQQFLKHLSLLNEEQRELVTSLIEAGDDKEALIEFRGAISDRVVDVVSHLYEADGDYTILALQRGYNERVRKMSPDELYRFMVEELEMGD